MLPNTYGNDEESSEGTATTSPEKNIATSISRSFGDERSVVGDGDLDPAQ